MRSVVRLYLGPPSSGLGREADGAVAQLGERRPCKAEVVGSIPISSTLQCWSGEEFRGSLTIAYGYLASANALGSDGEIEVKLLRAHGGCLGASRR